LGFTNRKRKYFEEKTTATLKSKQTSIATVRNHLRTLASSPTPLIFHWSLPLRLDCDLKSGSSILRCLEKKTQQEIIRASQDMFVSTNSTASLHCIKNPIYVFPEMKLGGLVPNSYIHVSVNDLYLPRIGLPVWLQQNMQIHLRNI
jgi:hypothetical protein